MAVLYYNNVAVSFGDGSSGNLTVTSGSPVTLAANTTYNYANVTVNSGAYLYVSRTATFNVSGTLTVNGVVQNAEWGGGNNGGSSGGTGGGGGGGGQQTGGTGSYGGGGGAAHGYGANILGSYTSTIPSAANGGNGGSGGNSGGGGGSGAGSFKIIANAIVVGSSGQILASGTSGGGGDAFNIGSFGCGERGAGGGGGGGTLVIFSNSVSGTGSAKIAAEGGGSGSCGGSACYTPSNYSDSTCCDAKCGGGGGRGMVLQATGSWTGINTGTSYYGAAVGANGGSAIYDNTPPVVASENKTYTVTGANRSQIISVSITDSSSGVNAPTGYIQVYNGSSWNTLATASVSVNWSNPTATFTITNLTGDLPARLVITVYDTAGNGTTYATSQWIVDNTVPTFTSSISPNKTYFMAGESITYTITSSDSNQSVNTPTLSLVSTSGLIFNPPSVALTFSSFSGNNKTYTGLTKIPFGGGTLTGSASVTDLAGNTGSNSTLSPIKVVPPSGIIWS